jgi:hypothetical protein
MYALFACYVCSGTAAPSVADAKVMIAACQSAGVQLMDGVMFAHNPRFEALARLFDSGNHKLGVRELVYEDYTRTHPLLWLIKEALHCAIASPRRNRHGCRHRSCH